MLFDSGRLDLCASVSVLPTAFFLSIYCHLPVSVLLIPPIVPFTHILLSTSLSRCDMVVVECLQFQQPPWPQGCFNSGVHHPVFMTAAPLKERSFLQSQMSWESLSQRSSLCHLSTSLCQQSYLWPRLKFTLSPNCAAMPGLCVWSWLLN